MWVLAVLAGCCRGGEAPELIDPGVLVTEVGVALELSLEQLAPGVSEQDLSATGSEHLDAVIQQDLLRLVPEPGWEGVGTASLTATGDCETSSALALSVEVGEVVEVEPTDTLIPDDLLCPTTFSYDARGNPSAVALAGSFNDWDSGAHPMTLVDADTWRLTLDLAPGAYPYKLVEQGEEDNWACNPGEALFQCDEGVPYEPDCPLGEHTCNSMVVVPDCRHPQISTSSININQNTNSLKISLN